MTTTDKEAARTLADFAKQLRQAKREFFSEDPTTLNAITPFDVIAYDMEKAADLEKKQTAFYQSRRSLKRSIIPKEAWGMLAKFEPKETPTD